MSEDATPQEDTGLGIATGAGIKVNASTEEAVAAAESHVAAAPVETAPNFRDSFLKDTDLYDNPSLATITDPVALAKAFVETKALVGKKGVLLPGKNATPEEIATFHKALGVPDTPDGYEIIKPADLPKEMPYNEERVGAFKKLAHKIGLNPTQVKELFDWQTGESLQEFSKFQGQFTQVDGLGIVPKQWVEDHNKTVEAFKSELGDKYEMMVKKAQIVVQKYGGQELKDFMDKTGFGDNPALIRAWIKVADNTLTEDDLVVSTSASMSRKERIAALNTDPAMLDTTDLVKHRSVVAERNKLIEEEYADRNA